MPEARDLQRQAFDALRHTVSGLAKVLRVSPHSVSSYGQGRRTMPRAVRLRLADYLEKKGRHLLRLAKELRRAG